MTQACQLAQSAGRAGIRVWSIHHKKVTLSKNSWVSCTARAVSPAQRHPARPHHPYGGTMSVGAWHSCGTPASACPAQASSEAVCSKYGKNSFVSDGLRCRAVGLAVVIDQFCLIASRPVPAFCPPAGRCGGTAQVRSGKVQTQDQRTIGRSSGRDCRLSVRSAFCRWHDNVRVRAAPAPDCSDGWPRRLPGRLFATFVHGSRTFSASSAASCSRSPSGVFSAVNRTPYGKL